MTNDSPPADAEQPGLSAYPAEASAPRPGWVPPRPPGTSRPIWQRALLIGSVLAGVLFIAGPLIFLATYNLMSSTGSSIQTVEIGRGGSGCAVARSGDEFPQGTPVRMVATFSPALPTGSSVVIKLHRDGIELTSRREIVGVDEPADCIYGEHPDLVAGHYRVVYEVESSQMPPLSGEFDITQ